MTKLVMARQQVAVQAVSHLNDSVFGGVFKLVHVAGLEHTQKRK